MSGVALLLSAVLLALADVTSFVDPFIGTAGTGHTTPAACVPYGLVQAGPDTGSVGWKYCSGYQKEDERIIGFSQTHLNGTGWMDLGDVRLMPVPVDLPPTQAADYSSSFEKSSEIATCGYYSVRLLDCAAQVEVTASDRVAFYRLTFDDLSRKCLIVDLQHGFVDNRQTAASYVKEADVKVVESSAITGCRTTECWVRRTCGFSVVFSQPFEECVELPRKGGEKAPRYRISFGATGSREILVKIGISTKSAAAAMENIRGEVPGWDFEAVRRSARMRWNELLSRTVVAGTDEQRANWYASLYHLCVQPNVISDFGKAPHYSTFSCWDTFRAAHPLYTIVDPEHAGDFVRAMLRQGRTTGFLPVWTLWGVENQGMIGTHSIPVIVDWFLKTRDPDVDWNAAYEQVRDTLVRRHPNRAKENWDLYDRYGYYPYDALNGTYSGRRIKGESVSRTLECAYDDACAARMARVLGQERDADFFERRSHFWKNVFDPAVGFARGRNAAGEWREPFDPYAFGHGPETANDFTEGNAFQYTWHVLHEPQELIRLLGGQEGTVGRFEGLFAERDKAGYRSSDITGLLGQYVHGNEPSHHVIYYAALAGRPDLTARRIREVFDRFYRPRPDGLCGNDDCGQMSAWFLFSAMGFYPFDPCGGEYVIGAPQLPRMEIKVKGQRGECNSFVVVARNLSQENKYVKSVTLNGDPVKNWKIRHSDIVKGGELVFEMTNIAERN